MRSTTAAFLIASIALFGLSAAACSSKTTNTFDTSFYDTPSPLPAGPAGTLVRFEPMTAPVAGSEAWRVMYTSTGIDGEPIVVTGMVFLPHDGSATDAIAPPAPIVSWAHPTTGIDDPCAPSRVGTPYADVQGLSEFLAKGWIVTATDYQGLGTDGMHPYLVGASEAHATIDIVRAARSIPEANASSNYFVFGHSQGGQAVLFAGQIAATYAPDLDLIGVAAAAPAGELVSLFEADKDTMAGAVLGSYAVMSWSAIFGYDESTVVKSSLSDRVHTVAAKCVVGGSKLDDIALGINDLVLKGRMWSADPATTAPWSTQFAINTPGQTSIPVPVLITQGTKDKIVIPATTAELTQTYLDNQTNVSEQMLEGVGHMKAGHASVPLVVPFFSALLP